MRTIIDMGTIIPLYRMTHIDNIPHILKHGITHKNSKNFNPDYKDIGDVNLISRRDEKIVSITNGTQNEIKRIKIGDFIPFYFGVRMSMLYNIQYGINVERVDPEKVVYIVINMNKIIENGYEFYFSDGHAYDGLTTFYDGNYIKKINDILDFQAIKSNYWGGEENFHVKRKKQAEFLVKGDIPYSFVENFICYNAEARLYSRDLGIELKRISYDKNAYYLEKSMIEYRKGNILESEAEGLVNTVNTKGVMGKGIALQFKKNFPKNFKEYKKACKEGKIQIGKLFVTNENTLTGKKIIINFPTKTDWKKPSEYEYIEKGLEDLLNIINIHQIKSIALPPLGAGNGGLIWQKVKNIIEAKLSHLSIPVYVYEPTEFIQEQLKKEKVKLTDARALMLYVLYDLVHQGEFVSEFSAEKVCYFLQRFGADKIFKLQFEPKFYGPYSGKVRYVLNHLNGSYIMGYSDLNKGPFEPLLLINDNEKIIKNYIENREELKNIALKTTQFLDSFCSDYALELLSSVDWIINHKKNFDISIIINELKQWNDRKSNLFDNEAHIQLAIEHLKKYMNYSF